MSRTLYRLPNTNLYLQDDGLLAGRVESNQEVETLTEANLPELERLTSGPRFKS